MGKEILEISVTLQIESEIVDRLNSDWGQPGSPTVRLVQVAGPGNQIWGWEGNLVTHKDEMLEFLHSDLVNAFHFRSNGIEFYGETFRIKEARPQLNGGTVMSAEGGAIYIPNESSQ